MPMTSTSDSANSVDSEKRDVAMLNNLTDATQDGRSKVTLVPLAWT